MIEFSTDNLPYEKVGKNEPVCIADEVPFEIPESWEWVRLIEVCEYIQRGKSPKYSAIKKYPVIAQKCNQWDGFSIEKAKFIEPDSLQSYGEERLLQDNDLMWNSTGLGTLGRIAIYKSALNPYELAVADSHVTVIRPFKAYILPEYLYYYFANPSVQNVIEDKADGTTKQKELATATIKAYLVPIPPLDEQKRILEKLEEVLPIVEKYKVVYDTAESLQDTFPDRLKKSILLQAVQGKLVPQDPSDEPAEVLLERIRVEKQRLIKEGKIKKDKHESVIFRRDNSHYEKCGSEILCIDEEIPFDLPTSWQWERLINIYNFIDYRGKTPTKTDYGVPLVTAKNVKKGYIDYSIKEYISHEEFRQRQTRGISHKGDILFSTEAPMGNAALADINEFSAGQRLITFQQYGECIEISNELMMLFILSDCFQNQLSIQCTGTTVKGIKAEKLKRLLIPIPPLAEQQRILNVIKLAFEAINTL